MSQNRWLYASANPLRFIDPTGHYNRQVAVQWAMAHDLMDPFPEGENFRNANGSTDCTAFASSVISRGGVSDTRSEPPYTKKDYWKTGNPQNWYTDYSPNSYWKREWAETLWVESKPETIHYGILYDSWQKTQKLFDFLTGEKRFDSFSVSASNLAADLQGKTFDIGDLVFYGTKGAFGHVAVISSRWAPQTFFGGFTPHPDVGGITTWTDYLVFGGDTSEQKQAFAKEALDILRLTRCESIGLPWLPRVVERSGAILYHGSRSINNTFTSQDSFTIVHIQ